MRLPCETTDEALLYSAAAAQLVDVYLHLSTATTPAGGASEATRRACTYAARAVPRTFERPGGAAAAGGKTKKKGAAGRLFAKIAVVRTNLNSAMTGDHPEPPNPLPFYEVGRLVKMTVMMIR